MGYRMRVYALSEEPISVSQMQGRIQDEGIAATIEAETGEENCWEHIVFTHKDNGDVIAYIERDLVIPDSIGGEEIAELISDLEQTKPPSAARFLRGFFQRVKIIYIFQIGFKGADRGDGWDAIHTVQSQMIEEREGILHADLEGFSNEDGYQITWEFVDSAMGEWTMAVLDTNDHWIAFRMDLGSKEHRDAFREGRVPPGLQMWDLGSARIL